MGQMKTFKEARGDTAVFTFGRFNPPTTGHEKLIIALARQQSKNAGSLMYVYPSHSQAPKQNPLPHSKKVAYMKKMFRKYAKNIIVSRARNVFEVATELHNKGHRAVVMVVGSDRVDEFDNLLNQYNGVEGRHGYYGFDNIEVVSAGERDPDAEGVEGMSASKMRAAAVDNDYDSFSQGLPRGFRDGKQLFDDVRKGMKLNEQNWTFEELLRDLYIRGELFQIHEEVETQSGISGTIVRKGTNYVVLETDEGLKRVWLHDLIEQKKITKTKQEKDIEDVKGTQPAKYYAKGVGDKKDMATSTKKSRARQFNRQAKMDDDDPKAYKPAPGDKGAKTKPSQYTKKFKQMYGEQEKDKKPQSDTMMDRDKLRDLEVKKRMATLQAKIAKDQETLAKMQIADKQAKDRKKTDERKLTDAEKDKLKKYEKDIDIQDFIDRYGEEEGKSIYYATLTKMAKGESLWANIHKKRERIKRGSGERMRKKGEKGAPTSAQMKRAKGESNESFDLLENKEVQDMIKHYEDMLKSLERKKKKTPGMGFAKMKIKEIIAKLKKDLDESYEIGKDYAQHTFKIDPYSAPEEDLEERPSTLKKDKKLPNLMLPKKGKAGMTKYMKRKNIQKLAADVQAEIDEQPSHEITVGDYTTTHFFMCGSAQELMKANKDKVGAIELTRLQDEFYKLEKDVMDAGQASELQKQQARKKYNEIMNQAAEMELADDMSGYMKQHLDSVLKGEPKPGFGRTDISEGYMIDEKIDGLVKKSEQTGVPYGILKKSYDRGMAAWKTGHRPGTTPQQWAFARVNSMLTGGKADPDLQKQIKAGGYKKKKKAKKESIDEWFNDQDTIQSYKDRYGDEWSNYLNNTYERMLSKLSEGLYDHNITEAEYQGRKVNLNKPFRTPDGPKKFSVYVKGEKGNVVKVNFGDPKMGINRDDPEARKSFRARHQCDTNPGPKWKARYWSCYQWRAGAKVED